jgi:hypothetical protein
MKRLALLCALGLAAVSSTWGPQHANAAKPYTIHGSLTASECDGGYDIERANVLVRDGHNRVRGVGTTSLDVNDSANNFDKPCKVTFKIGVPKLPFYQISIGSHGGPTYTFNEMVRHNWHITLSLGD